MLPELVLVGDEAVAAPEVGTLDLASLELGLERVHARLELRARLERLALVRGDRADPACARPRVEDLVGLLRRNALDGSAHANLAPERVPVEEERALVVLGELARLPAEVARREHEAADVGLFEQ